jgi:hypothetical protein
MWAAAVNRDSSTLVRVLGIVLPVDGSMECFFLMCDRMYEVPWMVYLASEVVQAW